MGHKAARNHHFVPRGYLNGFTDTGTKDGRVFVTDLTARSTFWTNPRNIAAERDFNRVEVEGHEHDAIEQSLGEFEGKACAVIRHIRTSGELPGDEELSYVLNLMTLLIVRNPRGRRAMNAARKQEVRIIGSMLTADRRLFDHHVRKAKEEGFIPQDADVSFEEMKRFIDEDNYTVEQTSSVTAELAIFQDVLNTLGERHWSLALADVDSPCFVTCDHPVAITPRQHPGGGPIGYGTPETEVTFPLGPRHVLIGVLERPFKERLKATARHVAVINARTVNHADRQVYSSAEQITIVRNGSIARLVVTES